MKHPDCRILFLACLICSANMWVKDNAVASSSESATRTGKPLKGFLDDVTIYPAKRIKEAHRQTFADGKGVNVILFLFGPTDMQVADYYKSILTEKGWHARTTDFGEALEAMQAQTQPHGYKSPGIMTFVKGVYTLEIGVTPLKSGLTLNITQKQE